MAGILLVRFPIDGGCHILLALLCLAFAVTIPPLFFAKFTFPKQQPEEIGTSTSMEIGSASNTGLLLLLVGITSVVETRYGINGHTCITSSLGSWANALLMMPIAIEIFLLVAMFDKECKSLQATRKMILAGPVAWLFVVSSFLLFPILGAPVFVSLSLVSFNILFVTAVAIRLPKDLRGQSSLAAAQSMGSLVAYGLTITEAKLGMSLESSWVWTVLIAVVATMLGILVVWREHCQHLALFEPCQASVL